MKKYKLDNGGYSLLEVIIVASIISLMTVVAFMSLSVLSTRKLDECAKKLKMGLETNRITTMGKLSASVSVYVDNKGYLVLEEDINGTKNTKRVGDSNLTYTYLHTNTTTPIEVPGYANKITIKFDRNSGALKPQEADKYISSFIIELGSSKLTVNIEKLTGRISVN